MMVTGSSICGRSMLGPNTVARFWTLILLTLEWDWTSSRNLPREEEAVGEEANPDASSAGSCLAPTPSHTHISQGRRHSQLPLPLREGRASPGARGGGQQKQKPVLSAWKGDTRLSHLQWGRRSGRTQAPSMGLGEGHPEHLLPAPELGSWAGGSLPGQGLREALRRRKARVHPILSSGSSLRLAGLCAACSAEAVRWVCRGLISNVPVG